MAKPGSNAARRLAAQGARDLSRLKMTDEEVRRAGEAIEIANGMRCGGCGKRIERGFQFVSIAPTEQRPVVRLAACSREDCGYATLCRSGTVTYVEQVHFVWLDEAKADAAPALAIVEENAEIARRREAAEAAQNGTGG